MCNYNDTIEIKITQKIKVDRCIAAEIEWLNANGIRTEGCCCGHGKHAPEAMIKPSSVLVARKFGYNPIYCPDVGLFKITLKSGEARRCSALDENYLVDPPIQYAQLSNPCR